MKRERGRGEERGLLLKASKIFSGYSLKSFGSVRGLGELFGSQKVLGYLAFILQPLLAFGQFIFHYSFFICPSYMLIYNILLLRLAFKKRSLEEK